MTSNGVSAVIDASGSIIASTAIGEQKLLIGQVSVREPPATLMVMWGDWVGRAGLVLLLLLAGFSALAALKRRTERSSKLAATTTQAPQNFRADGFVLTPVWRVAAGLLRVFACAGLLWIAKPILFGDGSEINTLTQMWMFAALVLAPEAAAWSIMRAFSTTLRVENDMLVLEQRERRIEIPVQDIAAVEPWKLPLPIIGVYLRLQSGQRWSQGLAVPDAAGLVNALISAGGNATLTDTLVGPFSIYARVRQAVPRWRIDHFVFKFVLFPLVPALPAFRLHQIIAYGGTFGEYQTFGLKAYLIALLIWWASWAMGMMLFAAALRVVIEASTLLSIAISPERAIEVRRWLELLGHLLFYVGVPAWLLIKLWP